MYRSTRAALNLEAHVRRTVRFGPIHEPCPMRHAVAPCRDHHRLHWPRLEQGGRSSTCSHIYMLYIYSIYKLPVILSDHARSHTSRFRGWALC